MALLGTLGIQKGPLWWAGHHRFHHRHSDEEEDVHSPLKGGFWWAHIGWLLAYNRDDTRWEEVKDLVRFPELRWLDRWYFGSTLLYAGGTIALGFWLERAFPATGVTWPQVFVWCFLVSTVMLLHTTYLINSGAHMWGSRRFPPRTPAATTFCWRSSRSAKAGTTTTTATPAPSATASSGGNRRDPLPAHGPELDGFDLGSAATAGARLRRECPVWPRMS